ncbi:NRDE family protein, partial [Vibrio parahaemolyticus]|nr:NRDE family protein [Vibrio parahaemolyticus]
MTKDGNLAVLTNYRETNTNDSAHPVHGTRSRGGMVTAWLGANPHEKVSDFVSRMLDGGVGNVGGFSLICGKLRP